MPRFRAIIFDLLTALLDSWTLWGEPTARSSSRRRAPLSRTSCSPALVTNTSDDLARRAAAKLGVEVDLLVSPESVEFHKPRPEPYRAGVEVGQPAVFVAGSAGAEAAGLPVIWHNRVGAPAACGEPLVVIGTLRPFSALIR